ncbi:hypothetical protein MMC22_001156 [Lobaria immixta]|nr:hypothetical protein [Lobaria immixta]
MDQGGNFMYEEDSTMAETDDDNDKPNVNSEQQDETADDDNDKPYVKSEPEDEVAQQIQKLGCAQGARRA